MGYEFIGLETDYLVMDYLELSVDGSQDEFEVNAEDVGAVHSLLM